jgi:hypothetical protein
MIEQAVEPSVARSIVGRPPRSLVERQICDPGPSCHPLPSTGASVLSAPGESDEIYGSGLDTSYAQLDTTGACEATSMPESSWARTLVCAAFSG